MAGPERPDGRPARLARWELPAVAGLVVAAALWAAATQDFRVPRYWDADEYFAATAQLAAGEPVTAAAPYAYRLLMPWIVAQCCAGDILQGYLWVNLAVGAGVAGLLLWWLRHFVASPAIRVAIVAAYVLQWHAPIRFVFYYPAYVDPLFMAFVLLALLAAEGPAPWTAARGLAYAGITALGTLARETMLVLPLAVVARVVAHRRAGDRGAGPWVLLGAGAAVAAIVFARAVTDPRGGYAFLEAAAMHLQGKPLYSLVLPWFIAFGPMLAVVAYDWRATGRLLAERLDLAAILGAFLVLSYIGGHDTERYLFWAMPVVYALVGRSLERHRRLLSPALIVLLVAAQAVAQRVFWPVPDPGRAVPALADVTGTWDRLYTVLNRVFVIDDFHWNLWSNFGSRPFHLVQLAFYLAVTGAVVWLMHRRAGHDLAVAR